MLTKPHLHPLNSALCGRAGGRRNDCVSLSAARGAFARESAEGAQRPGEPRRDATGDGPPLEPAAFAQMDAGRRLAYLQGLLAEAGAANAPAVDDWRRRNAPDAPSAEPPPIFESAAPNAPAKTKPKSSTPRRA